MALEWIAISLAMFSVVLGYFGCITAYDCFERMRKRLERVEDSLREQGLVIPYTEEWE